MCFLGLRSPLLCSRLIYILFLLVTNVRVVVVFDMCAGKGCSEGMFVPMKECLENQGML